MPTMPAPMTVKCAPRDISPPPEGSPSGVPGLPAAFRSVPVEHRGSRKTIGRRLIQPRRALLVEKPLRGTLTCFRMAFEARSRVLRHPGRRRARRQYPGPPTQRVRRSVNALDIIVIAVIALSALFAFARGFVKESLSIAACVGAGLITLYGLPLVRPFARKYISTPLLADGAAGFTLFVVSLIILSLLT